MERRVRFLLNKNPACFIRCFLSGTHYHVWIVSRYFVSCVWYLNYLYERWRKICRNLKPRDIVITIWTLIGFYIKTCDALEYLISYKTCWFWYQLLINTGFMCGCENKINGGSQARQISCKNIPRYLPTYLLCSKRQWACLWNFNIRRLAQRYMSNSHSTFARRSSALFDITNN